MLHQKLIANQNIWFSLKKKEEALTLFQRCSWEGCKIKHFMVEKQPALISLTSFSEELGKGKVALWVGLVL